MSDLPAISHFPRTPDAEWSDFRFLGLRSASAYLFVYDASDPAATFDVVRTLREQGIRGAHSVGHGAVKCSTNVHWPSRFNAELTRKLNFLNIDFREALLTGKLMLTIET